MKVENKKLFEHLLKKYTLKEMEEMDEQTQKQLMEEAIQEYEDEPEPLPYLVDIRQFLSNQKEINSQILLNELMQFLESNKTIKEKFVDFFHQEFQKQMESFEVMHKLEESVNNLDIRKIVPQISFIFSCPNMNSWECMQKYIRDADNKAERMKKIRALRKLHDLEQPGELKVKQKNGLTSMVNMSFVKKAVRKVKIVNKAATFVNKYQRMGDKLKAYNLVSANKLKNLSDPNKLLDNLNPENIKAELEKQMNMDNLRKSVMNAAGNLEAIHTGMQAYHKLKEAKSEVDSKMKEINDMKENMENKISEINSLKDKVENIDININNLNIEQEQQGFVPMVSDNYTEDGAKVPLLDKTDGSTDDDIKIKVGKLEESVPSAEGKDDYSNTNIAPEDEDLYLKSEDIIEEEFEKFLLHIFDKLEGEKRLIIYESIVNRFPEAPMSKFSEYFDENGNVLSEKHLYLILISYFATIINYFTGLKCKFYIDEADLFNIDFYLDEEKLREFAQTTNYKSQYKVISVLKDHQANAYEEPKKEKLEKEDFIRLNSMKYEDLEENDISHFPPYAAFDSTKKKRNHFRRYDNSKADEYHLCNKCYRLPKSEKFFLPECGSSYFRHIDKQRIVKNALSSILSLRKLMEKINNDEFIYRYLLPEVFYIHNYEAYDAEFAQPNIIKTYLKVFEDKKVIKMNNNFRNFLGEEFGFYYFWITHYIKALICPSIIGVLVTLFIFIMPYIYGKERYDNSGIETFITLPFSCLIILWSKFYYQSWSAKEKLYKHIWGMGEFFLDESVDIQASKNPMKYKKFVDIIYPDVNKMKLIYRQLISWSITALHFLFCISLNCFVFWVQHIMVNKNKADPGSGVVLDSSSSDSDKIVWYYIVPIVMFFVREFMTFAYYKIAHRLTKFEGHPTFSDFRKSFVLKASFFQFFNYYFNLYYIAFVKRYYSSCLYDNCKDELAGQLTIILTVSIVNDVKSLFWTIYNNTTNKLSTSTLMNFIKHEKRADDNDGSNKDHFYERTIYEEKNADKEYVQIIMSYGYIIQFGTASPICFFFALAQAFIARITDALKMTKYSHVNLIDGSTGLGSHLVIISFLNSIGLITNVTINLFVDDRALSIDESYRWTTLFIVENILIIFTFFLQLDFTPFWFRYKNRIKFTYFEFLNCTKEMVSKKDRGEIQSKI